MSFDLDLDEPENTPPPRPPVPAPRAPARPSGLVVGRVLPHSLEAEEFVLSCCFLDGADVIERCKEMQLGPGDFYDHKHGIVFDCIRATFARTGLCDISVVAEELKATRQLEQVGNYAFLTQISSRIPTTAQASYFIEKVKEQSILRELIRSATGAVEEAYSFSGGIRDFATQVKDRLERVVDGAGNASAQLAACAFDPHETIIEANPVFRLSDVPICTPGNLAVMVAPPGVGKSATIGGVLAAAMSRLTDNVDCLGFTGPNYGEEPLLHFDTEQSKGDFQKLLHRSMKRAGKTEKPAWLHSYHLTGKSAEECRHLVETAIALHARKSKNGKLFAVIIDGWADLVVNPNDESECFPFIARMHMLAIKHDTPIMGVLHLNPGKEAKSRGHLGSHLERKAETVLQLEMDADLVTVIWATKKRGAPIRKDNGPRFSWSDDRGMHVLRPDWQEQAATRRAEKKAKQKEKRPTSYGEQYSREEQVSFYPASTSAPVARPVVYRRAQETTKISDRSLERMRLQFLKDGWIVEIGGQFRRTAEGDDWAKRKPGAVVAQPVQAQQDEFDPAY